MFHAPRVPAVLADDQPRLSRLLAAFDERWPGARRRVAGLALAVGIEAALFLVLLTLGETVAGDRDGAEALTTVTFAPDADPAKEPPRPDEAARPKALPRAAPAIRPSVEPPLTPAPPPALIPMSKNQVAAADTSRIKAVVRDDAGPVGPPDRGYPGDSQRLAGSGPNGEPLYAARWYREPYDEELRGYLSTATSPGWALINCKTVSEFRVEDCVLVDEYPNAAGIGRAVMAAAWQFKVRPPQVGGRPLVGEWVRIRIDYEIRRK